MWIEADDYCCSRVLGFYGVILEHFQDYEKQIVNNILVLSPISLKKKGINKLKQIFKPIL